MTPNIKMGAEELNMINDPGVEIANTDKGRIPIKFGSNSVGRQEIRRFWTILKTEFTSLDFLQLKEKSQEENKKRIRICQSISKKPNSRLRTKRMVS